MENKFSYIKQRILQVAEIKGIAKEKFVTELGMTYGNFKGENLKRPINSDTIVKLLTLYPEMNMKWLLTGNGEMIKDDYAEPEQQRITAEELAKFKSNDPDQGIPLLPIEAFAGYGRGEVQVLKQEGERYIIPLFNDAEFLLTVRGSSMVPKYHSGDLVACKKMNIDTFFQWNKVYALDTDQGALIKRVKRGKDAEHLLIVSDNAEYEPFDLHRSHVHSIAVVIGLIRLE